MMLANALALGVVRPGGGASYDPLAEAFFERMSSPPGSEMKRLINGVFVALGAAGVIEKLDVLKVRAAATSQDACLNWVADQYNDTPVGDPAFTAFEAFTTDGVSSYLDSGFNPATASGAKFQLNDASMGGWHLDDLPNGAGISFDLGNNNSRISNNGAGSTQLRVNGTTAIAVVAEDYTKLKVWSRDGATSWRYYNDGALVGDNPRTDASTAFASFNFCTGRTTASSFGLNRERMCFWGASLSAAQIVAIRDAMDVYFAGILDGFSDGFGEEFA